MSVKNSDAVPGFCPLCGDILPLLTAKGGVRCYTCKSEWGANVFGDMKADYVIHFNRMDEREIEENKQLKNEAEGPVIERHCSKCNNNRMSYATLQLRSADEGQTVFYTCTKCGHKETENS